MDQWIHQIPWKKSWTIPIWCNGVFACFGMWIPIAYSLYVWDIYFFSEHKCSELKDRYGKGSIPDTQCVVCLPTFGRFFVASVGMRIRWDNEWFEQLKSHYFCKFNFFPSWFHHPFGQTTAIRFGTVNLGLGEFQNSLNSVNRRHAHFRKVMCVFFQPKSTMKFHPPNLLCKVFF